MALCPYCYSSLDSSGQCPSCHYKTRIVSRTKRILLVLSVLLLVLAGSGFMVVNYYQGGLGDAARLLSSLVNPAAPHAQAARRAGPVPPPEEKIFLPRNPRLSWEERRKLQALFENREFARLEQRIERYQEEFERNKAQDMKVISAYWVFGRTTPEFGALLDEWVAQSPESYMPYMARATFHHDLGWESRGSNWSSETSEEQFFGMRQHFKLAVDDLHRAIQLKSELLPAYILYISILSTGGSEEAVHNVFEKAQKIFPESYKLYEMIIRCKRPRWGGSYEEMFYYANQAFEYVEMNPALHTLSAQVYLDMADRLHRAGKIAEALKTYDKALAYGEVPFFYRERGRKHRAMQDDAAAIDDFSRAIELDPDYSTPYRARIWSLVKLQRYDQVFEDMRALNKLAEPCDAEVLSTYNWTVRMLSFSGRPIEKVLPLVNEYCPGEATALPPSFERNSDIAINRVFSLPPRTNPFGLTWLNDHLYMSSYRAMHGIFKINPANGQVMQLGRPEVYQVGNYGGLTSDRENLYMAQVLTVNESLVLDPFSLEKISSVNLYSSQPSHSDLAYQNGYIYTIGRHWQDTPDDFRLLKFSRTGYLKGSYYFHWKAGDDNNYGVTSDGTFIWVAGNQSLMKIDPASGNMLKRYRLPVNDITGLAWDGEKFWMVSRTEKMMMNFKVGI